MIEFLSALFQRFGLPAVIVCSFLENIVGFNAAFPGSIVILTSMALTAGKPAHAVATFFCIVVPSLLAHYLNFYLGRKSGRSGIRVTFWEILVAFFHPHTAGLACARAGRYGMSLRSFLQRMVPAALIWYAFWGWLMYFHGHFAQSAGNLLILFYAYLIFWIGQDVWAYFAEESRERQRERP